MKKVFLVFILGLGHSVVAQTLVQSKTIDECVNQFLEDSALTTNAGLQYWFVDKEFLDGRTLKMNIIRPGEATHAPHSHPEDEIFFVIAGTAEFYLDGKTKNGTQYSSFYCPPYATHGIRNVGDTTLTYLVIKKYDLNK